MKVLVAIGDLTQKSRIVGALCDFNYIVEVVDDGRSALYEIVESSFDAVVLSVDLPLLNGLDLLKEIRKKKTSEPVLILDSRGGFTNVVEVLNLGADDYFREPFHIAEFNARFHAVMRRFFSYQDDKIVAGEFEVNTRSRTISRGEEQLRITSKEYEIIEFLLTRRGRVVSRSQIYNRVSCSDDDNISNVLDVHICKIRKKLGKGFLKTIRSEGYMVE